MQCWQWHSQVTDDAQALHEFFFSFLFGGVGKGWDGVLGAYFPSKFLHLRATVATQIVLETIFEMPSVLNRQ